MNDNLSGIVEAYKTFILYSNKGKKIVGVIGRRSGGASLITDCCRAYKEFAEFGNLEIKQIKGGKPLGNGIRLNNVNIIIVVA